MSPIAITKEKQLETLAVLSGFCGLMALIQCSKGASADSIKPWVLFGFIFLVIGLFIPWVAYWITRGWLGLALVMGSVMSRVILSIVYFLVLLPFALLQRVVSKSNSLQLKKSTDARATYYSEVNKRFTAADLKTPW